MMLYSLPYCKQVFFKIIRQMLFVNSKVAASILNQSLLWFFCVFQKVLVYVKNKS